MGFTLFCHLKSPADAAAFFRARNAIMEGDENKWSATYVFPGKFLQKKKTITFDYDKKWCSPPNWPQQIQGMMNYIGSFRMEDAIREKVMKLIA